MTKHRTDNVERIKDVWFEDATYETIGERIGLSRDSVAGLYHRNPELRESHPVQMRVKNRTPADASKRNFSQRAARIEALTAVRNQPREYDGPHGRYTFNELPHNGCKWPFGEDPAHMTFCGHTRQPGEPYCTAHVRLAYTPRAEIQRRKRAAGMQLERLGR